MKYRATTTRIAGWRLSSDRPRILIAQLRLEFGEQIGDDHWMRRNQSQACSDEILDLVRSVALYHADFLILPEYSCPFSLLSELLDAVASLPEGSVCLLPFEHLALDEYKSLLERLPHRPIADRAREEILSAVPVANRDRAIVNPCLVVGVARGKVWAVPQLKLRPAGLEEPERLQRRRMYGDHVLRVIRGENCALGVAICFDFIAQDDSRKGSIRDVLVKSDLDLILVPECNPNPLHTTYALATLDVHEHSQNRPQQPVVVFANVADGTVLPGLAQEVAFGLSRIVGNLGVVTTQRRNVFSVFPGVLVGDKLHGLRDVAENAALLSHPVLKTVLIRTQVSLANVVLPTLGLPPSKHPAVGRTNTEVEVLRKLKALGQPWQPIRAARYETEDVIEVGGIPDDHVVDGLLGFEVFERALLNAVRTCSSPVWVIGLGGIGKTALVASVLHAQYSKDASFRIVWVDMARVPPSEDALREVILQRLGLARALEDPPEEQRHALRRLFQTKPTILVLDSFERSGLTEMPEEIACLHAWPSRVVVTSRSAEGATEGVPLELSPLSKESAMDVLRHSSHHAIPTDLLEPVAECVGRVPLALVWIGSRMQDGFARSDIQRKLLSSGKSDLESVYAWSIEHLDPLTRRVLAVLADLPEPVAEPDLVRILKVPPAEICRALDVLRRSNLAMIELDMGGGAGIHTKHPFVRQFSERHLSGELAEVRAKVDTWVRGELEDSGGDWNWLGFDRLQVIWPNLRPTLERHKNSKSTEDRRSFLQYWRNADYCLWSTGHWRERRELADAAATLAGSLGEKPLEAFALCASAEIDWYLSKDKALGETKLEKALALYRQQDDEEGIFHVLYYRARLLRTLAHQEEEARRAAHDAIAAAEKTGEDYLLGLAHNNFGNLSLKSGDYLSAQASYASAEQYFNLCPSHKGAS